MYVIAGTLAAHPEKKAQLIQLAQSMFAPSRAEVGCISYNFYEDTARKHHFLFFEEWEEKAAMRSRGILKRYIFKYLCTSFRLRS